MALAAGCRSRETPAPPSPVPPQAAAAGATSRDYRWALPPGLEPPAVPEANPISAARVELGRHLFYDSRLSFNGTQSCSSCHVQELAFADGERLPTGSTGDRLPRNSPGLQNAGYLRTLTWNNPLLTSLERQIPVPMFSEAPVELDWTGHGRAILDRLAADERYPALFRAAFPDDPEPDVGTVLYALSTFVRAMVSFDSPYDRYARGDEQALSAAARRGLELFESDRLGCRACHAGDNFTLAAPEPGTELRQTAEFVNVGLYDIDGQGAYPDTNTGVHELTRRAEDMGRMRIPSLRNVALTAPYRHDGSVADLAGVIREYEAGGRGPGAASRFKDSRVRGFELSEGERADLVAFLESLTDATFVADPRFSDPWAGRDR